MGTRKHLVIVERSPRPRTRRVTLADLSAERALISVIERAEAEIEQGAYRPASEFLQEMRERLSS